MSFRELYRARGLVRLDLWVTEDENHKVRSLLADLRGQRSPESLEYVPEFEPSPEDLKNMRMRLFRCSQAELAVALDVSPFTVNRWENGKAKPRKEKLAAIYRLARHPERLGAGDKE
jgi:DNA-binding transcriptional regulator YiaG